MRIPVEKIPAPIVERLLAVQKNPHQYDCFYRSLGGKGWAISALVAVGLALPAAALLGSSEELSLWVSIPLGIVFSLLTWASVVRLRRHKAATLKPMMLVNPLYLARLTLDELRFFDLWSELRDLRIVEHRQNGAYSHTAFTFIFKKRTAETITINQQQRAEALAQQIEAYRLRMIDAIEQQDFEALAGHDLFFEAREPDQHGQRRRFRRDKTAARRRRAWLWGAGAPLGALAGVALFFFSTAMVQQRSIDYCNSVRGCEFYFERFDVPLFVTKAQDKLMKAHQRRFARDKKSARKLRRMLAIKHAPFLRPAQQKAVLELYQAGSRRELRAIFDTAIAKYEAMAQGADAKAKAAMIRLLELARDKNLHRVKVRYRGSTEKPSRKIARRLGRVVSMEPSFTSRLNSSRERMITSALAKAFSKIVPEEVIEFPAARRKRYRSRYDRRRKEAPESSDTQLVFDIRYVVFPSGTVYVSRKNPTKRYAGIGFDWSLDISAQEAKVYHFVERSFPPARFSVSSYSRYAGASDGTVYSTMANRAFDDFSKRVVKRFGIATGESRRTKRTLGYRSNQRRKSSSRSL